MTVNKLPGAKIAPGYRMQARGDRGDIYVYGVIGGDWFGDGVTATQFAQDLKALGAVKSIDLHINSEGGSVFDGKAMYSLLVAHPATVTSYIDGLAASAASFLAMAGDEIIISEGGFVMIHDAYGVSFGRAIDMRAYADLLDSVNATIREVYTARTKNTDEQVAQWMDEETWFNAKDAVASGFADKMVNNLKVAACVSDPAKYKHLPGALSPKRVAARAMVDAMKIPLGR